jgi:hypothetical protein
MLSLEDPPQELSDDIQRVTDPSPFPFFYIIFDGDFPSSLLTDLVGNWLWSCDVEDIADVSVDEGLQRLGGCLCVV